MDYNNKSNAGINDAVNVPSTSEKQKMFKSMRNYLNMYSDGKMDKTMNYFKQFLNDIVLKKAKKKIPNLFYLILKKWTQSKYSVTEY